MGAIDRKLASKIISSIRMIKQDNDVKSVILRIDSLGRGVKESEVIVSELSDLSQKARLVVLLT